MSTALAVVPDDAGSSATELSRVTVVALLSRVLGDDDALHTRVPAGEYAELIWEGERISTQWYVYPGDRGVRQVEVSLWDSFPVRPVADFRAEAAIVVGVLRDLAHATGGRFHVEEADVTDSTVNDALDLIAGPDYAEVRAMPERAEPTESDDEYLRRYLAAAQSRMVWLREQCQSTGGPRADQLNRSPDSLVPLWAWAIDRFQLRADDAPKDLVVSENRGRYYVPRDAVLPMWYGRSAFLAPDVWSDDSLALVDAIASYVAECLMRAVPELRWETGHAEFRGYMHEGQPTLAGFGDSVEPITSVLAYVGNVYHVRRPDEPNPYKVKRVAPSPEDLRDWFDSVVGRSQESDPPGGHASGSPAR